MLRLTSNPGPVSGVWRGACAMALAWSSLAATGGQSREPASALVDKVHAYLIAYEPALSGLIADEVFDQTLRGGGEPVTRHLVSDFSFLRLPGGLAWLGQRSVRAIDGTDVKPGAQRLDQMLVTAGPNLFARAKAIADGNAVYNLGSARSMNVPTLPLDLLGRRRAAAFTVHLEGREQVGGRPAARLLFTERAPGAIVAFDDTRFNRVEVRAWVADDGAVLRADVALEPPGRGGHDIRVDYVPDAGLGILVPARLTESFDGRQRGDGRATYRNYRKFQTAGRLLPPGA